MTARIRIVWGGQEALCELEQEDGLVPFDSFDEIPLFADEEEEAPWFAIHRPSGPLLEDEIRRGRERRERREAESSALRQLRELVPPRPRELSRMYPAEDEGKRESSSRTRCPILPWMPSARRTG